MKVLFCTFLTFALFYFLGVESCSVKPSLTPLTTKMPQKLKRTTEAPRRLRTKAPKTVKSTPIPEQDDESRLTKYSKYAKRGFYVEIEETVDNKTRVFQMQQLPPIYSRTTTKRETPDAQNASTTETKVEQVYGAETNGGGEEDVPLTEEDLAVQKDWEGDCLAKHWNYCNSLKHITVMNVYNTTAGRGYEAHHMEMDCLLESIACLKNGWTVNRCQIICMSKCNKAMLQGYDSVVQYSGPCNYI